MSITSTTGELSEQLCYACWHCCQDQEQKAEVIQLLKLGANPNSEEAGTLTGTTPLHYACQCGWVDVVQLLIAKPYKCDPETRTRVSQMTPLHYACKYGRHEIAKLLIEKFKCNPNVGDSEQKTPLHYACHYQQLEVVKLLASMDECEINAKDRDERTPLHYACECNHTSIISELVQHDADPKLVDRNAGNTPLHRLLYHKLNFISVDTSTSIMCLLKACNPNIKNKSGLTPLQLWWTNLDEGEHDIETLRIFLAHGADPNVSHSTIKNKNGLSPLHYVCKYGDIEIANLLVEKFKCNPNVRDIREMTPLHYACQCEQLEVVKLLVSMNNCDLNAKDLDRDEWTPLHYACVNNHTGIISELVQHGADPNLVDCDGDTPLHILIYHKKCHNGDILPSLKCLLEAPNCNPNIKNESGLTPLVLLWWTNLGEGNHDIEILRVFSLVADPNVSASTKNGQSLLHYVCKYGEIEIAKLLVEKFKCNPNVRDIWKMTPLHYACQLEQLEVVKLLVSMNDCDLNAKDSDRGEWTPLHYACVNNHTGIINELVQHGANPNLVDCDGDTPLHILIYHKKCQNLDIFPSLKCLLEAPSCNPNIKNNSGLPPLLSGCGYGGIELLRELLAHGADPNVIIGNDGNTPLHIGCQKREIDAVKCLLEAPGIDVNAINKAGLTPLQVISPGMSEVIIRELVAYGANPNVTDSDGNTPLHNACQKSAINTVKYLLKAPDIDPNVKNEVGLTPLQVTPSVFFYVIKLLIAHHANPNVTDNDGNTPLHKACHINAISTVKCLLEATDINPNVANKSGLTPLQVTLLTPQSQTDILTSISQPQTKIVRELITHGANPNVLDNHGNTPLHNACQDNESIQVKFLLESPDIDPNAKNKDGLTPLQVTTDTSIIRELIRHGANAEDVYKIYGRALKRPLQPPVKVCIVGNPSVGKSTLTAALQKESSFFVRTFATAQKVTGVDERTAGVVPHEFESKLYGYATLYDFAGQREFYGSHAALLQNVIQTSPPVFLIVVDLRESEDEITQTILYWLTFLENQCASVNGKPHVIIVGSHADILRARGEDPKLKITFLKLTTTIPLSRFVFVRFIAVDCQYPESPGMENIRKCLKSSCKALRPKKTISFNAHCFYVYLIDKFKDTVAVTVEQIRAQITREDMSPDEHNLMRFIPGSLLLLCKICDELNERGHVLFLKDLEAIEQSWVVIDKECLLATVSGSIFAPEQFKQHKTITQCACSTGVVPLSSIAKEFPDHDSKMLIKFLCCLEFCHEMSDPEILHCITEEHQTCIVSGPSHSPRERYFLFPALVSLSVPAHVWDDKPEYTYHCGWILRCSTEKPEQFFTSRFLQVVLLRTAFSFPLSEGDTLHSNPAIQRNCSIWKNGIFWGDASGVETLIEVVPDNKAVIVLMRCDKTGLTNLVQLRSQVICKVLQAKNEFCNAIDTLESFIDPSETTQYPLKPASQLQLFSMSKASRAILDNKPSTRVVSPTGTILLERLVPCEPYAGLGEDILWEIFEERDQDIEKIPDSFLSRIAPIMAKNSDLFIKIFTPEHEAHSTATACDILSVLKAWRAGCAGTYKSLREKLDEFSVFAGRDPLALAGVTERKQSPKEQTAQSELPESSPQDDDQNERESPVLNPTSESESMKNSDVPKLKDLVVVLKAVDWHSLGLQLDLDSTDLNEIDDQYPQRKIDRKRSAMFEIWLANEPGPSWEKIVTALERVGGHIGIIRTIQRDYLETSTQDNQATDDGQNELMSTQDVEQIEEVLESSSVLRAKEGTSKKMRITQCGVENDEETHLEAIPQKGDQPTLKQLQYLAGGRRRVRVIESVAAEWEHLATALGFEVPMIDYLRRDFSCDAKGAATQVLTKWLNGESALEEPITWDTLIQRLIEAGLVDLAEELGELLKEDII